MDIILKQRLVGAIVLISLGVIFIPMLLTGKGDSGSGKMDSNIPATPNYQLRKPALIIPEPDIVPAHDTSASTAKDTSVDTAAHTSPGTLASTTPKSGSTSALQQAVTVTLPESTHKSQSAAPTQTKPQASSKAAAKAPLSAQPHSTTPSTSTPTVSTAKKVATKTTNNKTAAKPAAAVTGWVVQVGSFEQRANANQLRDKLRHKGFAAFVEPRKDSHDKVYRVRVGPELKRPTAEDLQKKLLKQEKLKGIVMQYPAQD